MSSMYHAWNDQLGADQLTKEYLGGKGFGLFEMATLKIPVPEFVVIPTTLCVDYMAKPAETKMAVKKLAKEIIDRFTKELGYLPLLSVRSGARVSMPGMMDTILNVGMGDVLTESYCNKLPTRSLLDCKRRYLHMYGSTTLGLEDELFEKTMTSFRTQYAVQTDAELNEEQMREVVDAFEQVYKSNGKKVCYKAREQIEACILAVMDSWNSPRAAVYREQNDIPNDWGTAVVIQRMVFGNMNDNSSSGVAFSRDPSTGAKVLTGEFLPNAQGEDVVAGIRTPLPLTDLPESVFGALDGTSMVLEQHFKDMLDMEFTVEDGKLYMLQVRTAKRSARAWVRSSLDLASEGLIDRDTVFQRIKREHVKLLTQPVVDPQFTTPPHLVGLPGCHGVAVGKAVFNVEQAVAAKEAGTPCILIRHETTPDDIKGMFASIGILTATGGATSHAAVVARGMDKVCVTGCEKMITGEKMATIGDIVVTATSTVTLDGTTGRVWFDTEVPVSDPSGDPDIAELTAFLIEDSNVPYAWLPCSEGDVYMASQFLAEVPAPKTDTVTVIDDTQEFKTDLLMSMTVNAGYAALAAARTVDWAHKHNVKVTLYSTSAKKTETNGVFTSKPLSEAPKKIECQRHLLMAAFK